MKEKFYLLIKKLYKNEAIRYIFIGGCTTLVNLVTFYLFIHFVFKNGTDLETTVSNVISVIISIIFAYITNKLFVFQAKTKNLKDLIYEFAKFVGARLSTMVIEVGGVYLLASIIGQTEMVAKLETQVIVIIGNYFISKWFVFTKGSKKKL
jgi:putative flippase GtrA